jgi:hypothetical protein
MDRWEVSFRAVPLFTLVGLTFMWFSPYFVLSFATDLRRNTLSPAEFLLLRQCVIDFEEI